MSSDLRLDWCSYEAAKYACEHWHYSKSMQAGKCAKVGVWESGEFIGAVIFTAGSGSTTKWASRVELKREQMAELARVALKDHNSPVTRIVSIAIRLLQKQSSGLRLLVSYADPREGHNGGIYQAGNWTYVGQTDPDVRYVDKSGREHHSRMACPSGIKISFGAVKRVAKTGERQKISVPGKHKYLMPLDSEMRTKILPLAKPYPKRVRSETGDTAAVQVAEGGSTPTLTLQNTQVAA